MGDEFIIIMPETDLELAVLVCDKLRARVEQESGQWLYPTTVSGGIASFPGHGSTASLLLQHAEKALKTAKNAGQKPGSGGGLKIIPRFSPGACVTPLPNGWRLEIPAGEASAYRFAQLDDYTRLPRRQFPSHPPSNLEPACACLGQSRSLGHGALDYGMIHLACPLGLGESVPPADITKCHLVFSRIRGELAFVFR